jgi:CSLREA domain-containing protein
MKTLLSLCLAAFLSVFSSTTYAADFTVNLTTDEFDANFNDGICDIDLATSGEQCTLRAAINEAGFNNSNDTIGFSVAGEITLITDESLFIFSNNFNSNEGLTINGPGASSLIINGNNLGVVFLDSTQGNTTINNLTITGGAPGQFTGGGGISKLGGTLSLSNVIISGNKTNFGGGGIAYAGGTLIITNSTITNNESDFGGGISFGGGSLTITNSTISDNDAETSGGGVGIGSNSTVTITDTIISGNTAETFAGGGILLNGPSTATISDSTISSNTARFSGGIGNGGILNLRSSTVSGNTSNCTEGCAGGVFNGGTLNVTNSTISGNRVPNGNINGGGMMSFGTMTITNSTITNNLAAGANSAGGIISFSSSQLCNTIVAANQNNIVTADVLGSFSSFGGNLIGNVGFAFGFFPFLEDQIGGGSNQIINPLLGPLADNGGPTQTHALLEGSPAIDRGRNDLTTDAFDQRGEGFLRIADGNSDSTAIVDIGAFEVQQVSVEDLIESLIELVKSFDLHQGIENALLAKLNSALEAIEAGDTTEARESIQSFINQVRAQSGKKITADQSEVLIEAAEEILEALE